MNPAPNIAQIPILPESGLPAVMVLAPSILPPMPQLPINLPAGKLPLAYAAARTALEKCWRLDECKDWADKFRALSSYARQARNDDLYNMAVRIQARAVRRCGELLQQLAPN